MPKTEPDCCPCGSRMQLAACCAVFHSGTPAPDPESLMRSRYTAYVLGLEAYLLQTWHPRTRPESLGLAQEAPVKWLGLAVHEASSDGQQGTVDFVARYKVGGRAYRLVETSRFVREQGHWFYVDGEVA